MAINHAARAPRALRSAAREGLAPSDLDRAPSSGAFRALVDAVVDYAIYLISPEGRVQSWNRGAQRIKGYEADEIIGQPISVFYTREAIRAGRPAHNLRLASERGHFTEQAWRVRKDGTRFWADIVITPLRDEHGRLTGFAKVTRDLTARKAAEEHERQLAVEREARAAAEEALRSRDRFLSIASHELRTPVASMQLAIDAVLLRQERGSLDADRLNDLVRRMERAAARMASLLGELLDVSRLSNDDAGLAVGRVDLADLVQDVADRFAEVGRPGRITTELEPVAIDADSNRIDQVVCNLIDNALKYSCEADTVNVGLRRARDGAVIEVTDAGRGLDMGDVGLFEPFARGANVTDQQGLGLGLFIAHQIVDRHGGTITAANREMGAGATFRVFLPERPRRQQVA
ncbi:MAG: PAS domain-containing sensor histidine kinase [Chloroflexota bacterium]|nr:PAS domain-containing sensor histidine kinase [Chloroflexota bacterium]